MRADLCAEQHRRRATDLRHAAVTAVGTTGSPTVSITAGPANGSTLAATTGATPLSLSITPTAAARWVVTVTANSDGPTSPYTFTISAPGGAAVAPRTAAMAGSALIGLAGLVTRLRPSRD